MGVVTRRRAVLAGCTLALPSIAQVPETAPVVQVVVENHCRTAQQVAFASYVTPDTLHVQGWTTLPFSRSLPVPLYTGRPIFHYAYLDRSLQQMLGDLGEGSAAVILLPTNPEGTFAYQIPANAVREMPGVSRRYGAGHSVITVYALRPPALNRAVKSVAARRNPAETDGDWEARVWRVTRLFLTEEFAEVQGKPLPLRCP